MYEFERRVTWLGVGTRRVYPVEALALIDLVREADMKSRKSRFAARRASNEWDEDGTRFGLSFVKQDDAQLCGISNLTEGEARWMADVILRGRPEWFR
jgi:hypothetical protein